jgi:hypothetical protein
MRRSAPLRSGGSNLSGWFFFAKSRRMRLRSIAPRSGLRPSSSAIASSSVFWGFGRVNLGCLRRFTLGRIDPRGRLCFGYCFVIGVLRPPSGVPHKTRNFGWPGKGNIFEQAADGVFRTWRAASGFALSRRRWPPSLIGGRFFARSLGKSGKNSVEVATVLSLSFRHRRSGPPSTPGCPPAALCPRGVDPRLIQ